MTLILPRRKFLEGSIGIGALALAGCGSGQPSGGGSDVGSGTTSFASNSCSTYRENRGREILRSAYDESVNTSAVTMALAKVQERFATNYHQYPLVIGADVLARCRVTCEPVARESAALPFSSGVFEAKSTIGGTKFCELAATNVQIGLRRRVSPQDITLQLAGVADGFGYRGLSKITYRGNSIRETFEIDGRLTTISIARDQQLSNLHLACLRARSARELTKDILRKAGVDVRPIVFALKANEHSEEGSEHRKASFEIAYRITECS